MPGWYPALLASVSGDVTTRHRRAVAAANAELQASYWSVGREILDRQDEEGYGTKVIGRLSADLKNRFPEARGYSPRNLKHMRAFAAAWPDSEVVQGGLAQLPWCHHIALLEKLDTAELRQWYAAAALEGGWTTAVTHVLARRAGVQPAQHRRDRGRAGDDPEGSSLLIFPGW